MSTFVIMMSVKVMPFCESSIVGRRMTFSPYDGLEKFIDHAKLPPFQKAIFEYVRIINKEVS